MRSTNCWLAKALGVVTLAVTLCTASAAPVVLQDLNSFAVVDLGSQAGMSAWSVNGVNQLNQQWFWFRVGSSAPASLDSMPYGITSQTLNSIAASYTNAQYGFAIDISYALAGGPPDSADIKENILVRNLTSSPLDFHFYQYSDFDLAGSPLGDNVTITPNALNLFTQATQTKGVLGNNVSETIDMPLANFAEAGDLDAAVTTLSKLNGGVAFNLNNNLQVNNVNATWALQWDFTIAGNGSQDVIKDKLLQVDNVPEPALLSLAPLAGLLLALRRKTT